MGRREKPPPSGGVVRFWRFIRDVAPLASMVASAAIPLALGLVHLARFVALFLAVILFLAGASQRIRAAVRSRDSKYRAYPDVLERIEEEVRFARLWIATTVLLAFLCLLLPWPSLAAAVGASAAVFVFLKGVGSAGRSAEAEVGRELSKGSAAQKCWRIQRWARWAASARLVPGTRCFYRLAHYVVPAGQVGPLHAAALTAAGLCFFAYASLALAAGISEVTGGDSDAKVVPDVRTDPPPVAQLQSDVSPPLPTYAQSCPQLPDPLRIGHGLGELFRHEGAARAGCGGRARPVSGTGAWVAAGTCARLGETRSVTVSSPGEKPVILYGEPARFAWAAALDGDLIGAEAARPAAGDFDVIETRAGNYAFARRSRSIGPGAEDIAWCWEATGKARPFARLQPPLAWLWLELIRRREAWSWPVAGTSSGEDVSFEDPLTGSSIASGGCEAEFSCHLSAGEELWPYEGTAFVTIPEFLAFMPAQSE